MKPTAAFAGTTFALVAGGISGNAIEVRGHPSINAAVDWGVFVNVSEGKS